MVASQLAPSPAVVLAVFQALADENRLRILDILKDGGRCVCDIQASLDIGQSLLSHHLGVLRQAGLVHSRKEGRWVHYNLADEILRTAEEWIAVTRQAASEPLSSASRC